MNGSVFSKARYINGLGFEILARTPVPKLPLGYPTPRLDTTAYVLASSANNFINISIT